MPGRRTRVEREHEVISPRDLVRMHAEPVHPAIARRAAVDEPAVANGRVRDGQIGPPPRLAFRFLVHDRLCGARLAVVDVSDPDLLRRAAGSAQPQCRGAAHFARAIEKIELGAVVMRLVQRRGALPAHDGHPFTAPCDRPLTMKRWSHMKSAAAGTAAMSAPAAK